MTSPLSAYRLLESPAFYAWFQLLTWRAGGEQVIIDFAKPINGEKVLDIGCGPGNRLNALPAVDYTGFDLDAGYIEAAKKKFPDRGRFYCGDVASFAMEEEAGSYDLVLAIGILHHVNDDRARRLFELARRMLKPSGRLVTVDASYADKQSAASRWLVSRDRGQFVRHADAYQNLASGVFPKVSRVVRHDLCRMPYTHTILRCEQ